MLDIKTINHDIYRAFINYAVSHKASVKRMNGKRCWNKNSRQNYRY